MRNGTKRNGTVISALNIYLYPFVRHLLSTQMDACCSLSLSLCLSLFFTSFVQISFTTNTHTQVEGGE